MNREHMSDDLHRVVKLAMDSGEMSTLDEAERLFAGYRLVLEIGPDVASSPTLQAAVLTALNTGRRCFLGGVQVVGNLDIDLRVPWRKYRTLGEAVLDLQGNIVSRVIPTLPRIVFGDAGSSTDISTFAVQATFHGWSGGVIPLEDAHRLPERDEFTPSGVLAGALAVSEAFQFVRGGNTQAGRREVGLSLWRPEAGVSWLEESAFGPPLEKLPLKLWLIGLGHLGQAYLWTLGLLPYTRPDEVQLVLQDYDTLVLANDSTSLFTSRQSARERWGGFNKVHRVETVVHQPAYQALKKDGLDQCGLTMLAGRSVGASFVGATTAAIAIAELLRLVVGAHQYEAIDGNLRALIHRQVVTSDRLADPFNPGYTQA